MLGGVVPGGYLVFYLFSQFCDIAEVAMIHKLI
jgi:hypothetical protein